MKQGNIFAISFVAPDLKGLLENVKAFATKKGLRPSLIFLPYDSGENVSMVIDSSFEVPVPVESFFSGDVRLILPACSKYECVFVLCDLNLFANVMDIHILEIPNLAVFLSLVELRPQYIRTEEILTEI